VLSAAGITVDFVPDGESASALASDLPGHAGERVCFLAGARAGQDIEQGLTRRSFFVERIDVYDTVRTAPDVWSLMRAGDADAAIFTSSSTVEATVALLGRAAMPPLLLSIGAKTTMTAQRLGLTEILESARPRLDSLVELLVEMVAVRGVANR
jgi:uroporphyrinogen-III synthase